jgi:DNA-binding NarL/FixJ family response regulator
MGEEGFHWKVLLVEDEEFTRGLVANSLEISGVEVRSCPSVSMALTLLQDFEPHVVITDLDLGQGPSGVHLLERVAQQTPWVGMAILSAHASPELAVRDGYRIPEGTVYAVKSEISSSDDLVALMQAAVERRVVRESDAVGDRIVISQVHGEILRMIAEGLSNAAIAKERNTSLRAAEGMVQRTFVALGIGSDADRNARVLAVRMWQQGKVIIR